MLCNLCMKDVGWTIEVKEHLRDHPMTYIVTREICFSCLLEIAEKERPKIFPDTGIYTLSCPKGHDVNKPGLVIHCDDIEKGPFYCPECKTRLKKTIISEKIKKEEKE